MENNEFNLLKHIDDFIEKIKAGLINNDIKVKSSNILGADIRLGDIDKNFVKGNFILYEHDKKYYLKNKMKNPVVIDSKNIIDQQLAKRAGLIANAKYSANIALRNDFFMDLPKLF